MAPGLVYTAGPIQELADSMRHLYAALEAATPALKSCIEKINRERDEFINSLSIAGLALFRDLQISHPEWGWLDVAAEIERRRQ